MSRRVLRILQDSRQQIDRSALFPKETRGRWRWDIEVVSNVALQTGDYSLEGWTGRGSERAGITVEWKRSIDELAGNLKNDESAGRHERDRFKRELVRMLGFERRRLVICEPMSEIFDKERSRNQWNPDSLMANLEAIAECGVAFAFFDGEAQAALYVTEMMRRFAEKKRGIELELADERAAENNSTVESEP